jgi:hypothetical protein
MGTNPRQTNLFDGLHPKSANIQIKDKLELVQLADVAPWTEMTEIAMHCRASKVKALVGPEPHYRELLGAVGFMAVRQITYRQAEDLIAHYAPARYLCNLMDSTWNPDHITIFEFTQMLGPVGLDLINRKFLLHAESLGILDSSTLMSDTTAQEAMIPYPNEVGLMKRFTDLVGKNLKKIGGKKLYHTAKELHEMLKECLNQGSNLRSKSGLELERLSNLMDKLFPQILHFLETGFVASKKIIHLQMSELYSIVRGKAPNKFGFDRGGHSKSNLKNATKLGVKHVGIAPTGKAKWAVSERMSEAIRRERAQVEGVIGNIKSRKYGFNKPNVKSTIAMETSGHRSILGFNLVQALRKLNQQSMRTA